MRNMKPADDFDCFERFCTLAGYRESKDYGGSLPSIAGSATATVGHQSRSYLAVPPLSGSLRRSRSDSGNGGPVAGQLGRSGSETMLDGKRPEKPWPLKLWSSIKCLAENCHGSEGCLLSPDEVETSHSAPHSRTGSMRRRRRARQQELSEIRPRTSSMPTRGERPTGTRPYSEYDAAACRVRNFHTTANRIVNSGDLFRRKTASERSVCSCGSDELPAQWLPDAAAASTTADIGLPGTAVTINPVPRHHIRVLGAFGVGKTTLARQFLTSVCLISNEETTSLLDVDDAIVVPVLLNDIEATLDIREHRTSNANGDVKQDFSFNEVDAYVIVYSISDRMSFHHAIDLLYQLRKKLLNDTTTILVANKVDLERCREVAAEEGKSIAENYNCKYIEVSALISLKVDDLLAGILSQIRLHQNHKQSNDGRKSPIYFLGRLLKRPPFCSRSCENMLAL